MIQVIKRENIFNGGFVELLDSSDFYKKEKWLDVIQLATICYGKEHSKNPQALWDLLKKEGTKESPYSKTFEFIPIVLKKKDLKEVKYWIDFDGYFFNEFERFCYKKDKLFYTNYRALANFVTEDNIDDCIDSIYADSIYQDYKVVKMKIPKFIFAQLRTHSHCLSWLCQSSRYTDIQDYWLPDDFEDRLEEQGLKINSIDDLLNLSSIQFEELFKSLGYKREVYSRGMEGFKYVLCIVGGWKNDPFAFDSMLKLRSKNHTQEQTRVAIEAMKKVFEEGHSL